MNTTHREALLDAALEESFPASDPASVFTESPKRDFVQSRVGSPSASNGIPWKTGAAVVPVLVGLAGLGVRVWHARKQRAVRMQQHRRLFGLVAATVVVSGVIAAAATWRARRSAPTATTDDTDDYPLFV